MGDIGSALERVRSTLVQLTGSEPARDEHGNWILPAGSARVVVNVVQPSPAASPVAVIGSLILTQVPQSAPLLAALNQVNAQLMFVRVYWVNGSILAQTELMADSLDLPELSVAVGQVSQVADGLDDSLRSQVGGLMPFAPAATPNWPIGQPAAVSGLLSPTPIAQPAQPAPAIATAPATGAGMPPPPPMGETPTITGS